MNTADIISHLQTLRKQVQALGSRAFDAMGGLNKRTVVVIAALILPALLLAAVIHSGTHPRRHYAVVRTPIRPHPSLEQRREEIKNRLVQLKKMTPGQWEEERRIHPWAAASLQDAIDWNTKRLGELEAMTPEQWEAQFNPRLAAPHAQARQQNSALDFIPQPLETPETSLPPTTR